MRVETDFDLTNFNSYKIKATCSKAFFPENEQDFIQVYKDTSFNKVLLGGGYNVILSKERYDYEFVMIGESFSNYSISEDHVLVAEAGCDLRKLSEIARDHALSSLEIFYDIPSSLGGAVVMNAGASGEEIKDLLIKVRYLDLADLTVKEILNEDIGFEYRNSFFQKNTDKLVLKAWLQLKPGNKEAITSKMEYVKAARWAKQPKEFPNAGSVFKRPKGYYVGAMIDELQLKGTSVGGAKISEKHGGFIINFDNAKGEDIISLIRLVQKKVSDRFGVMLEVEQRII